MKIEPMFGRIFVETVEESDIKSTLIIPMAGRRDRGKVINAGESTVFKVGDLVLFDLRRARIMKIEGREFISLAEEDVLTIIIDEDEDTL